MDNRLTSMGPYKWSENILIVKLFVELELFNLLMRPSECTQLKTAKNNPSSKLKEQMAQWFLVRRNDKMMNPLIFAKEEP